MSTAFNLDGAARRGWLKNGVLLAAGLALGGYMAVQAAAGVMATRNAPLALRLDPNNPTALLRNIDIEVGLARANRASLIAGASAARQVLRHRPLSGTALRLIATGYVARGQGDAALDALNLASRLSRRDLGTQILAAQLGATRGDYPRAVAAFDVALRTSRSSRTAIFPMIAAASQDRRWRPALRALVATDPRWLPELTNWAVENPRALIALTPVLLAAPVTSPAMNSDMRRAAVPVLAEQSRLDLAWWVYRYHLAALRGEGALAADLDRAGQVPPFDWVLESGYGRDVAIDVDADDQPVVVARIDPGAGGTMITRTMRLEPGRWTFAARAMRDSGDLSRLRWTARCLPDRNLAGVAQNVARGAASGTLALTVNIPAQGCRFQRIAVEMGSGDSGFDVRIDRIAFVRAAR